MEYALGMNCLEVIPAGGEAAEIDRVVRVAEGQLRRLMASTLEASLT